MSYPKIAGLKTAEAFRTHVASLGIELPLEESVESGPGALLAGPLKSAGSPIGNRFCILPMEGWDGETDGRPTDLTRRRWRRFGESGAKLMWGGEAVAVRHDGRANPNQLLLNTETLGEIAALRETLVAAHVERFDDDSDLLIGLQLTHSGRFSRPNEKKRWEPRVAYRHPLLDPRVGVIDDAPVLSDADLDRLVDDFVVAATLAARAGFAFVDVKQCHGYLGHELLSGRDRPGRYGGDFENRTRFFRNIAAGIQAEAPGLEIGVRLSVFDFAPYHPGQDGIGEPDKPGEYRYAFGGDGSGQGMDLSEPSALLNMFAEHGVRMVCTTAGSPYYNPHIQRPATFPPSDGYQPPEDPLVGVARQIDATAKLKQAHPDMLIVGSGYTYLQEWLPGVAQAVVRAGWVDSIGLGRMVLSYPELPADVLAGRKMPRKFICRTFSECTSAPRNGMISGCFPLDPFYRERPEREQLAKVLGKGSSGWDAGREVGWRALPLNAGRSPRGEGFDFGQGGLRYVAGERRQQRPVRPAQPQCVFVRPPVDEAVDQARRKPVAAADPTDYVELHRRADVPLAVDPQHGGPIVAIGRFHFAEGGGDGADVGVRGLDRLDHAKERLGVELGFRLDVLPF